MHGGRGSRLPEGARRAPAARQTKGKHLPSSPPSVLSSVRGGASQLRVRHSRCCAAAFSTASCSFFFLAMAAFFSMAFLTPGATLIGVGDALSAPAPTPSPRRRQSAAEIRWEHIDLDKGTLLIPNPKGGTKRAFVLPMSDFLIEVLGRRRVENKKLTPDSPWVFPSDKSKTGHIVEPKLAPAHKANFVVPFSVHGLRHTWITAANAAGLSPYDIKMLTNHMLPKGDVTAGYIGPHIEALRASQQRVTDYLRRLI